MGDQHTQIVGEQKKEPEIRIMLIYKPITQELGIHRMTPVDIATLVGMLEMARFNVLQGPQQEQSRIEIPKAAGAIKL